MTDVFADVRIEKPGIGLKKKTPKLLTKILFTSDEIIYSVVLMIRDN